MQSDQEPTIPLADVVSSLRRELEAVVDEHREHDLSFRLGPVEVELQFEVGRELGTTAGIQFWVVSLGGSGKRTNTATHRVKMTLEPEGRTVAVAGVRQDERRPG